MRSFNGDFPLWRCSRRQRRRGERRRHFDPYSRVAGLNKNDDLDVSVFQPYMTFLFSLYVVVIVLVVL